MSESIAPSRFRWFLYGLTIVIFGGAAWYFSTKQKSAHESRHRGPNPAWAGDKGYPASPVRVVAARRQDLPVHLKAIGTVTPLNTVTVRSRVDGQLLRVTFDEGQLVRKGDLLAEIDPAPYRIRLAQAEAQQRQNQALLETAKADLERIGQLFEKKLVTIQEMQTQRALVNEREGAVAADQAEVDDARLQLSYTRIDAPITGRVGLRRVDAGNLVRAGDTNGLVVITQTQPIAVQFTIPEIDLQKVLEPVRAGEPMPVQAWDRSETKLLTTGMLKTVDNQIDLATGTLRLKAEFSNDDELLFPNQFVNVRLKVRTLKDAIVIPAAAVQFGSRGTYVYTVKDGETAAMREIKLGVSDGDLQAVESGLAPGDPVVLEGLDRLRDGRRVVVVTDRSAAQMAE